MLGRAARDRKHVGPCSLPLSRYKPKLVLLSTHGENRPALDTFERQFFCEHQRSFFNFLPGGDNNLLFLILIYRKRSHKMCGYLGVFKFIHPHIFSKLARKLGNFHQLFHHEVHCRCYCPRFFYYSKR